MKKLMVLTAIVCAMYLFPTAICAQRRPVKKPATVATPVAPEPKATAKVLSPAENFFNEGLKCDARTTTVRFQNISNFSQTTALGILVIEQNLLA